MVTKISEATGWVEFERERESRSGGEERGLGFFWCLGN